MDILNTKTVLALGLSSAMSVGTASTNVPDSPYTTAENTIIAVSSPNLRVTVYDGIATLFGTADSLKEADTAEAEIRKVPGIEHVINLITWG